MIQAQKGNVTITITGEYATISETNFGRPHHATLKIKDLQELDFAKLCLDARNGFVVIESTTSGLDGPNRGLWVRLTLEQADELAQLPWGEGEYGPK